MTIFPEVSSAVTLSLIADYSINTMSFYAADPYIVLKAGEELGNLERQVRSILETALFKYLLSLFRILPQDQIVVRRKRTLHD